LTVVRETRLEGDAAFAGMRTDLQVRNRSVDSVPERGVPVRDERMNIVVRRRARATADL
jgi:hypothetical protein